MLDKFLYFVSWAFLAKLIFGFVDAISPGGIPKAHVRFRNGTCHLVNGFVSKPTLNAISETLESAGVTRAVIRRMNDGSFRFSGTVPERIRQRLRNMIAAG